MKHSFLVASAGRPDTRRVAKLKGKKYRNNSRHAAFWGSLCGGMMAMATVAQSAPVQWETANGGNGHWYDFVILDQGITTLAAEAAAESSNFMGEAGYLATITSSSEQSFLNTIWTGVGSVTGQFNDYSFFLIGASDRDNEGSFEWIGGEEEGDALAYSNFKPGEPNNNNGNGGDEDYVFAWWEDSAVGFWNDGSGGENVRAYLVEYDQPTSIPPAVPIPAGFPLLLTALGGLAYFNRKKAT